jgi:hypothetical protein
VLADQRDVRVGAAMKLMKVCLAQQNDQLRFRPLDGTVVRIEVQ